MPIKRPDIYEHNNSNLAVVDSSFVRGGGRTTANLTTLLTDFVGKEDQLKDNVTLVWVTSEKSFYQLKDKLQLNVLAGWEKFSAGDPNSFNKTGDTLDGPMLIDHPDTTGPSTGYFLWRAGDGRFVENMMKDVGGFFYRLYESLFQGDKFVFRFTLDAFGQTKKDVVTIDSNGIVDDGNLEVKGNVVIHGSLTDELGNPIGGGGGGGPAITVDAVPTDGSTNAVSSNGVFDALVLKANSDHIHTKADIGLGEVDNTSDVNKPISTATQTALDGKEPTITKNTAFNKNFGTTTDTVAQGDDIRFTDQRVPTDASVTTTKLDTSLQNKVGEGNKITIRIAMDDVANPTDWLPIKGKITNAYLIASASESSTNFNPSTTYVYTCETKIAGGTPDSTTLNTTSTTNQFSTNLAAKGTTVDSVTWFRITAPSAIPAGTKLDLFLTVNIW